MKKSFFAAECHFFQVSQLTGNWAYMKWPTFSFSEFPTSGGKYGLNEPSAEGVVEKVQAPEEGFN